MSVSPVDPPSTLPTVRLLDRLHLLELSAHDPALVTQALSELRCQQLTHIEVVLGSLSPVEGDRLRANLGTPVSLPGNEIERICADAQALEATFEQLSANYDPMLKEIATLGRAALKNSTLYSGRERTEELSDALRLLRSLLQHPIGSRNYAVWFECGWVQWVLGHALTEVEEAFYHASRLSGGANDLYHRHALRHLAFIQAAQTKWAEAAETMQRVLADEQESEPDLFIEAARYSLYSGQGLQAKQHIEQALDQNPELAFTVFADPDMAPLYPACLQIVERLTQNARHGATHVLQRLQVARTAALYLGENFSLGVKLPDLAALPLTAEGASLFEAQRLTQHAQEESAQFFSAALSALEKEHASATESARRLKAQVDQAISEKAYYEGSIKNVEDHARESGFSLHPYTFNNPFLRRRNQMAEQARIAYDSFKQKLAESEEYIREQLPKLEIALEKQEIRARKAKDTKEWLESQRG